MHYKYLLWLCSFLMVGPTNRVWVQLAIHLLCLCSILLVPAVCGLNLWHYTFAMLTKTKTNPRILSPSLCSSYLLSKGSYVFGSFGFILCLLVNMQFFTKCYEWIARQGHCGIDWNINVWFGVWHKIFIVAHVLVNTWWTNDISYARPVLLYLQSPEQPHEQTMIWHEL